MSRRYLLHVKGKSGEAWPFEIIVEPEYVESCRADGLDIADLHNTWLEMFSRLILDKLRQCNPFS